MGIREESGLYRRPAPHEVLSYKELFDLIINISEPMGKALAAVLYLTGGRIGEIIEWGSGVYKRGLHQEDIEVFKDGKGRDILRFRNMKILKQKKKVIQRTKRIRTRTIYIVLLGREKI